MIILIKFCPPVYCGSKNNNKNHSIFMINTNNVTNANIINNSIKPH